MEGRSDVLSSDIRTSIVIRMSSRSKEASRAAASGQRGEVRVDGVRIVYETWGEGPALVCCHAFAVDRTMWDLQRARFSESHRLITFDQRGCGESDHPAVEPGKPDPYTIDTFADDLRGILDDLGIERASVLGLSMGAATALRFAIRWPERVERLVLASAMASRLPDEIIERAQKVVQVLEADGLAEAYRMYFGGPLFDGIADRGEGAVDLERLARNATPDGFVGCFRVTIDRPSVVDGLHRITAPTLVLVGANDVHYLQDAELMSRAIPEARKVILDGVGHAMSAEAPEVFADEVLGFLSSPGPGVPKSLARPPSI
jgi:pimeloyl-ACP methyl ester carboxylesterase